MPVWIPRLGHEWRWVVLMIICGAWEDFRGWMSRASLRHRIKLLFRNSGNHPNPPELRSIQRTSQVGGWQWFCWTEAINYNKSTWSFLSYILSLFYHLASFIFPTESLWGEFVTLGACWEPLSQGKYLWPGINKSFGSIPSVRPIINYEPAAQTETICFSFVSEWTGGGVRKNLPPGHQVHD